MESAFSTLGFVIFGLWISIYAIVVESHLVHLMLGSTSRLALRPPPQSSPGPGPSPSPSPAATPHKPEKNNKGGSPHPSPPPSSLHHDTPHLNDQETKRQSHQMNAGKVLGLLFLGMAGIMQIGVVGFLVFKRRQLLRTRDRYETGERDIGWGASDSGKNVGKKYVTSGLFGGIAIPRWAIGVALYIGL